MQNLENFANEGEDVEEEDTHIQQQETSEKLQLDGRAEKWNRTTGNEHYLTKDS